MNRRNEERQSTSSFKRNILAYSFKFFSMVIKKPDFGFFLITFFYLYKSNKKGSFYIYKKINVLIKTLYVNKNVKCE